MTKGGAGEVHEGTDVGYCLRQLPLRFVSPAVVHVNMKEVTAFPVQACAANDLQLHVHREAGATDRTIPGVSAV